MRYMLMICDDGAELFSPPEIDAQPEFVAWLRDVEARGASHSGTLLRPPAEAVTVRVRDGRRLTSDGPFAETKEWVAGCEVVECADLDEAIAIASAHPSAGRFPIEIRPFWED
ncbi:YciI family protein [Amycolatopsis sp. NBC_00355]|uniref:YciI family protein n=1 Tax=Amycolatopsis sp. NBC_00355 TaxID=2975957 RepID=UPI0030E154DF